MIRRKEIVTLIGKRKKSFFFVDCSITPVGGGDWRPYRRNYFSL